MNAQSGASLCSFTRAPLSLKKAQIATSYDEDQAYVLEFLLSRLFLLSLLCLEHSVFSAGVLQTGNFRSFSKYAPSGTHVICLFLDSVVSLRVAAGEQ